MPAEDWLGPGAGVADMNGELAADGAADPSLLPVPSCALPLMCIPPPLPGKALWLPVADTGVDMAPGYAYVRDGPPDADDGVDGAVACWYELAYPPVCDVADMVKEKVDADRTLRSRPAPG